MALIKCKECGREISDSAKTCPHCGYKSKERSAEEKNRTLRIKQWIYTGVFLIGLILTVVNGPKLCSLYDESKDIFAFYYYKLEPDFTFMEYLTARDETDTLWSTAFGAIMILVGGIGALKNRGRRKRNEIEAQNDRILYGPDMAQGSGGGENLWTCASCGQVNLKHVASCQSCGVQKSWSDAMTHTETVEQKVSTCTQCGAALRQEDAFCMHCGAKVSK